MKHEFSNFLLVSIFETTKNSSAFAVFAFSIVFVFEQKSTDFLLNLWIEFNAKKHTSIS